AHGRYGQRGGGVGDPRDREWERERRGWGRAGGSAAAIEGEEVRRNFPEPNFRTDCQRLKSDAALPDRSPMAYGFAVINKKNLSKLFQSQFVLDIRQKDVERTATDLRC